MKEKMKKEIVEMFIRGTEVKNIARKFDLNKATINNVINENLPKAHVLHFGNGVHLQTIYDRLPHGKTLQRSQRIVFKPIDMRQTN